MIATDPTDAKRLLAAVMHGDRNTSTVAYASFDGGKTWQPTLTHEGGKLGAGDPAACFGPDGVTYFVNMRVHAYPSRSGEAPRAGDMHLQVARSADGGKTWREAEVRDGTYIDRPWLAADLTNGRHRGRVYCNAISAVGGPKQRVGVFTSADGGKTFRPPQTWPARSGFRTMAGPGAVVLSDGTLVVMYNEIQGEGRAYWSVRRSDDGGETFDKSRVVGRWDAANNAAGLACDPGSRKYKDRLYAAWLSRAKGRLTVMFALSKDRGETWSEPVALSEQPTGPDGRGYDAYLPAVAASMAGVVAVSWCDQRDIDGGRGWDVRLRASLNGGESWLPSVRVNEKPARTSKSPAEGDHSQGDTAGLAAGADGVFHVLWQDNRTGLMQAWTAAVTARAPR
jgi:hypothetical protein